MSYAARETSTHDASPVELYEFRRGTTVWRYTTAAVDITYGGYIYYAVPLRRSSIEQTAEVGRSRLRVTLPRDADLVREYVAAPPAEVVTLTVYRQHRGVAETVVIWMGRVLNVEWRDAAAEIVCEPVYTSLHRTGLRRLYQRNCPHVLYGVACGVSAVAYRVLGSVASAAGNVINVAAAGSLPNGYFAGGYLSWVTHVGTQDKRMITAHISTALTLTAVPVGLSVGQEVSLYPGCDHTLATCHGRFANSANYGGFPAIPQKNPFAANIY